MLGCIHVCAQLQSRQFAGLQISQPLPFLQVCPLYVPFSARIGRRKSPTLPQLSAASLLKSKQTCCTAGRSAGCSWGSPEKCQGGSLPQGFPTGTLSAKTVLFFRLESDLSSLKGRASVSGRFSAGWCMGCLIAACDRHLHAALI